MTHSPSISLAELSPQNIGAAMRLCSWTQERSSVLVPWGRKTMPVAFETGRRGKDGLPDLGGGPRVLRGRPVTDAACGGSQVGPRARCPWWPESACSEPAQRSRGWSVSLGPWAAVGNSLHVAFTSVDGQLLLRVLPGCVLLRCVCLEAWGLGACQGPVGAPLCGLWLLAARSARPPLRGPVWPQGAPGFRVPALGFRCLCREAQALRSPLTPWGFGSRLSTETCLGVPVCLLCPVGPCPGCRGRSWAAPVTTWGSPETGFSSWAGRALRDWHPMAVGHQ